MFTPTAVELAESVRSGSRTAVENVAEALARIARCNDQVGSFQVVRAERALAEAALVDGMADKVSLPLAGVPVAIKDNIPVAGEPMRDGSAATDPSPQPSDHPVVTRLRAAGAVVIGLTKVPELCVFAATDSVYGITRNPWDLSRTAGGSSGGSAAALASGQVSIAHGNDGMGSIRIPAANCGLVGIKPGSGLVPQEIGVDAWFGMSENGVLATTVADAALMLSVLAGRRALAAVTEPAAPLRIAVVAAPSTALAKLDPEWARGLAETAAALRDAGHSVSEVRFPYLVDPIPLLARWTAGAATDAAGLDPSKLQSHIRMHARVGRVLRRLGALRQRPVDRLRKRAEEFFTGYDLLLTPTLAQSAIPAIEWHRKGWLATLAANIGYAPYPSTWNLLGWPAASVPAGLHAVSGTPLAVQIVAPQLPDGAGEARIISLAAQLERLRPWPRLAPAFSE